MKTHEIKNHIRQQLYDLQRTYNRYSNSIDVDHPLALSQAYNIYNWALNIITQIEDTFPDSITCQCDIIDTKVNIGVAHYKLCNIISNNTTNGSK